MASPLLSLLLSIIALTSASLCPSQSHGRVRCSFTNLYIFDVSSKMDNLNNINTVFDYFESKILPQYDFEDYQNILISMYGANGSSYEYQSSHSYNTACQEAENFRKMALTTGLSTVNMSTSLKQILKEEGFGSTLPITLFTANDDEDDINEAGKYIRKHYPDSEFTVVSFKGSFSLWRNFHTYGFYSTTFDQLFDMKYLDLCILDYGCHRVEDFCDATYVPSNTTYAPPYTLPTVQPPFPSIGFPCQCNSFSIWNDVVAIFDTSFNEEHISNAWAYFQNSFKNFNIVANTTLAEAYMRLGIVTFSSTARTLYSLGSINQRTFSQLPSPTYSGSQSNVEVAILQAMQLFASAPKRDNDKNVAKTIVLFGSQFTGNDTKLALIKNQFFASGGNFIIYDSQDSLNPQLAPLTQWIIPSADNGTLMETYFCYANCHCPSGSISYFTNPKGTPGGACYYAGTLPMNKALADRDCAAHKGYVSSDDTQERTQFFYASQLASPNQPNWIGLVYNGNTKSYAWADGSLPYQSYQPWSAVPANPPTFDCVTLKDSSWYETDCRQSFNYVCEIPPCDSMNLCN